MLHSGKSEYTLLRISVKWEYNVCHWFKAAIKWRLESLVFNLWLLLLYPLDWSYLFCSVLPWAKSKVFTVVKQPMQSKELRKKLIHFLFTNDGPPRFPFQCMQCVTNMYIIIVHDCTWTLMDKVHWSTNRKRRCQTNSTVFWNRRLTPKLYMYRHPWKILLWSYFPFNLKRIIFISFRYGFCQALAYLYCDLVGRLPIFPVIRVDRFCESNKSMSLSLSLSQIHLPCSSFVLNRMEVLWDDRHQPIPRCYGH